MFTIRWELECYRRKTLKNHTQPKAILSHKREFTQSVIQLKLS